MEDTTEVMALLQMTLQVCGEAPVHKMVLRTIEQIENGSQEDMLKINRCVQTCMSILEMAMTSSESAMKKQFGIIHPGYVEKTEALQNRIAEVRRKYPAFERPIPRKLYISDLHFFHESLNTQMDRRGFADLQSMHDAMVSAWNASVLPGDEVYILGDFSMAGGRETNEIARQLHGSLYLITGNHDHRFLDDHMFDRSRFGWIQPYAEVRDHGRKVILSHYPIVCYNGQYRRAGEHAVVYMLYGHVHNTFDETLVNRHIGFAKDMVHPVTGVPVPCNMINCFCMFCHYQPQTLDAWIEIDARRRAVMDGSKSIPD